MIFTETGLPGAFLIEAEPQVDDRGFFVRIFCQKEFTARGVNASVAQANTSFSRSRGTLRGLHYQLPPHAEAKLVFCTQGSVYDVIVDLRSDSPTFRKWYGVELTSENHRLLYLPEGFAHGHLTLADDTLVTYLVSEFYAPRAERGIRYDDPAFGIQWPEEAVVVSEKDLSWPDFQ
jgi:dTDP-4-dehydrorhamnose 3,5-epimerase